MGGKLIFIAAVGSPTSQDLPSIGWEVYNYYIGCHSQQCVHACIQCEEASIVSVPYSNWVAIVRYHTQPILKLETPIPNCITEDHRGNETHKRRQPTSFISRNNATMCGKLGSQSFAVFSRLLVFHSGRGRRTQTSSSNVGKRECSGWVGGWV